MDPEQKAVAHRQPVDGLVTLSPALGPEAAAVNGDRILLTSPHEGVYRTEVSEIRVDDQAVETVGKGEVFTLQIEEKVRPTTKLYKIVDA